MTEDEPRADVSDMFAVHNGFRSAFGSALTYVASTTDDPARVALVADFYDNVIGFLHVHHEGEDELVTPLLLARADQTELVQSVAAQHQDVLVPLAEVESALGIWRADPTDEAAAQVVAAIAALDGVLTSHLDQEEGAILPLCADHLSAQEWGALPAHGMANFPGDKIWLILGLIQEQMTADQQAEMLAHMPPPAVEMWTGFGHAAFDGYVAELRQTA